MKYLISVLAFLICFNTFSQTQESYTYTIPNSVRLETIDETLREYGKQQAIANKITIITIASISIGTLVGIPAVPLLMINMVGDLTTIIVTSRSNRKLAKHKSK